ncbi:MAG: cell division transport system permease protein [Polaribacter sp.]|jgi:cell division transport system permease protein
MAFYANQMIQFSKENINIMVEIKEESTPEETENLNVFLKVQPFIKPGSIVYTTKEEAAEEMKTELGDFSKFGFQNPFRDVLHFNISAEFMKSETLAIVKDKLMTHKSVYNVYFQEAAILAIERNIRKVGIVMLGLGLLFLFVAITLIHNTIRLALYANRFLIKNMQLVGASWRFISRPYLWKSIQNGFWSSLMAIGGLLAVIFFINFDFPSPQGTNINLNLAVILGALTILGMLITFLSTLYVVNKYLKMRVDDLY